MTTEEPARRVLTTEEQIEKLEEHGVEEIPEAKDVAVAFKALRLSMYIDVFVEDGFDDSTLIKSMSESELDELVEDMKMKPGHAMKFKCWANGVLRVDTPDSYLMCQMESGVIIRADFSEAATGKKPEENTDNTVSITFYGEVPEIARGLMANANATESAPADAPAAEAADAPAAEAVDAPAATAPPVDAS